jgi:transcriptional regulator with XRE-family HTH domain
MTDLMTSTTLLEDEHDPISVYPTPRSLGAALVSARLRRSMKQSHVAELLGVTQPTVSRIERGDLYPADALREEVMRFVAARLDVRRDAGLRRLVEMAAAPVHIICDLTHRLLAASPAREQEWERSANDLKGVSLWPYASDVIREAEARLGQHGWGEPDGACAMEVTTNAHSSDALRILPGRMIWERMILSDGSPVRLVTNVG